MVGGGVDLPESKFPIGSAHCSIQKHGPPPPAQNHLKTLFSHILVVAVIQFFFLGSGG